MIVGVVSETIKNMLGIPSSSDNTIYMGATNISHMETSHPADYAKYKNQIRNILAHPDYVGLNPKDGSIEYVKSFVIDDEYVKVAVRVSSGGRYYARSIYVLNKRRVENFIKKGTLKKVDIWEN